MDALFENAFMNLTSKDEVQDRGTIRLIPIAEPSTPVCDDTVDDIIYCYVPSTS